MRQISSKAAARFGEMHGPRNELALETRLFVIVLACKQ